MQISVSSTLTLYHDGQFWVGIIEHIEGGRLGAARIVFGAEPSNEEVLQFVVQRWEKLSFFGEEKPASAKLAKNPKRRMRDAAKALNKPATSTKAQKALAEQREAAKGASIQKRSKRRAAQKQARFAQSREKRKQKHRGH